MPSIPALIGTVHADPRQVLVRALSAGLIACVLIAVPLLLHYRNEAELTRSHATARERHFVELASRVIVQTLQSVVSDLRYLSAQNELKDVLAGDTELSRRRLAEEYSAFLAQKPHYDQVRWIGPDGWEKIRVQRVEGRPRTAPPDELQNKALRYYFGETSRLGAGQIYVSPLDLNVEHDVVEEPQKPTLRVALPVFHPDGQRAGILVVNYLATPMLAELRALVPSGGSRLWLLNPEGYWLLGPDGDVEWAFMYPERVDRSLPVRDPALWEQLSKATGGSIEVADGLLTSGRVYPLLSGTSSLSPADPPSVPASAADYYWIVATHLPRAVLEAGVRELARHLLVAYGALAALAFAVASGLAFLSFRTRALGRFVQRVLDHVPALVAYVDADERYRYNNRYYEVLFGMPASQLAGRTVRSVIGEAAYAVALPHIRAALAGEQVSFEVPITYSSAGARNVAVSYVPDVAADGKVRGFIAVVNDVTRLKAAEHRERQRLQEAAHATRLASVGELATQIAHEVNQPITAIVTYCAAAQRNVQAESPANARLVRLIGAVADEAQRVSAIIRRLRDFIRKDEIAFVAGDVNEIVANSLRLVAAEAASQQVRIVEDLAPGPLPLMADPVLLSQATVNLVRNAIEAVAGGATGPRNVTVATARRGRAVEVSVTDSGPGLPPEVAGRLFEAFVTTKPNGLGMGLSIARSIIEAHGGQIHHSEPPEGGCRFTLTLPGVEQ